MLLTLLPVICKKCFLLAFTPFIMQCDVNFLNWYAEENLVVNSKHISMFMSKNYRSDIPVVDLGNLMFLNILSWAVLV